MLRPARHSQRCEHTHDCLLFAFICGSLRGSPRADHYPAAIESHRARCETPAPACAQPNKGPSPCSLAQLPNLSWLFGANQPSPWGPCDVMCCQSDVGGSPALLSFVICGPHYRAAGLNVGYWDVTGGGGEGDFKIISRLVHFAAAW